MSESNKFYLTTPIYYVNARPHIGHTYTTIVADAIARRKRSLGLDTWFLTGTDEHGQKIERSAQQAHCTPQQFADRVSAEFRGLWDRMGLTYDDFIRTTRAAPQTIRPEALRPSARPRLHLQRLLHRPVLRLRRSSTSRRLPAHPAPTVAAPRKPSAKKTTSSSSRPSSAACSSITTSTPNSSAPKPAATKSSPSSGAACAISPSAAPASTGASPFPATKSTSSTSGSTRSPTTSRLSAGARAILPEYEKFWPADLHLVGKEIIRFHCVYWPAFLLAAGLPLPKSVHAHGWLLFEESKMSKSRGNIVRTETILEGFGALKPELPKAEQDLFGADALRYFLLREIVFGQDGSFSFDALVQRYNSDLANGYGNLVSRTLSMIGRYFDGLVPYPASSGSKAQAHSFAVEIPRVIASFAASFDAFDFSRALETAWALIAAVDGYLTANAPWKQLEGITDEQQQALRSDILYTAAEAIRIVTALVYPVIPDAAARVWAQLGLGDIRKADLKDLQWRGLQPGTKLGELSPLFPRADKETITRMNELEQKNTPPPPAADSATSKTPVATAPPSAAKTEPHISKLHSLVDGLAVAIAESTTETAAVVGIENAIAETVRETIGSRKDKDTPTRTPVAAAGATPRGPEDATKLPGTRTLPPAPTTGTVVAPAAPAAAAGEKISIDDFSKVELRVAQVKVAERVPKADKLLRLEVDLGYETRQILAGIAEAYTPESLIGRKVVIVANLAPRKLRGFESNGMIVAASVEGGRPVLAGFLEDVEIGARLK